MTTYDRGHIFGTAVAQFHCVLVENLVEDMQTMKVGSQQLQELLANVGLDAC